MQYSGHHWTVLSYIWLKLEDISWVTCRSLCCLSLSGVNRVSFSDIICCNGLKYRVCTLPMYYILFTSDNRCNLKLKSDSFRTDSYHSLHPDAIPATFSSAYQLEILTVGGNSSQSGEAWP